MCSAPHSSRNHWRHAQCGLKSHHGSACGCLSFKSPMPNSSALRDALNQSPNNLSLLLLYGRACLEELHLDEAREIFTRALEQDPEQTDAQLGIAKVSFMEGNTSGAAVRAERVLFLEPDNVQAHLLLSRVFLSEEDRAKAIEHFDRAAQIDGTMSDPYAS